LSHRARGSANPPLGARRHCCAGSIARSQRVPALAGPMINSATTQSISPFAALWIASAFAVACPRASCLHGAHGCNRHPAFPCALFSSREGRLSEKARAHRAAGLRMHGCNCTFRQLGRRRHRRGGQAPIKPYPLRNCGVLPPNSLTKICSARGPAYCFRGWLCQSVQHNSYSCCLPACWRAPVSRPSPRTAQSQPTQNRPTPALQIPKRRTIACPGRRVLPRPAATGTTASTAPPSASAGMCAQRAARRQRPHPCSRIHRQQRQPRRSQRRRPSPSRT
jgi:hypothetical protein